MSTAGYGGLSPQALMNTHAAFASIRNGAKVNATFIDVYCVIHSDQSNATNV